MARGSISHIALTVSDLELLDAPAEYPYSPRILRSLFH